MRKAKYSAKKVYLPKSSRIGYGVTYAKPGHWITWGERCNGRVLGRIDESSRDGLENCDGWLAVMSLGEDLTHAFVRWVNPAEVTSCRETPPAALLAWITGDEWPKTAAGIPRMLAMAEHGTCSDHYIAARNDPSKPFNARTEYARQFVLE
jgi:hypothetical protein